MNNTLGHYNDERGNYTFGYYTEDGKHVNISFRAEPEYDLDIVFKKFLEDKLIELAHYEYIFGVACEGKKFPKEYEPTL